MGFFEPRELNFPTYQPLVHVEGAGVLQSLFVICFLCLQRLVVDESACTRELMHGALLRAVWHQFEFKGLQLFHCASLHWLDYEHVQLFAFILALKDEVSCF
jgi:hypothetical protein